MEKNKLDMADIFAEVANLILTSMFFHPLLPVSIPIALCGLSISYWVYKVFFIINFLEIFTKTSEKTRGDVRPYGIILFTCDPLHCVHLGTQPCIVLSNNL